MHGMCAGRPTAEIAILGLASGKQLLALLRN